ncbi:MAG: energy transducer TonB [Acidobacteriota bacterium]
MVQGPAGRPGAPQGARTLPAQRPAAIRESGRGRLRPPSARSNDALPVALVVSVGLHAALFGAVILHPAMSQRPRLPDTMMVRLVDLPAGRGGALDGTPGRSTAPAPRLPEPPKPKNPKTTLPGKAEAPKSGGESPVRSGREGKAVGLGGEGAPGLGGKASGLLLDEPTFEYEWYKARLEDLLKSNWKKPVLQSLRAVSASVHFVITAQGDAQNVEIVSSSGLPNFDQSVLRAVYSSAPFPRFPPAYKGPTLGVMYTFELLPEKQ